MSLNINPDWAKLPLFDRSKWQRVRFGDVVENVNETERDPGAAGIERFIAMEHLEPGSLHVRSWGNVADGTTFNRRCRPGQVLFGKRRAYQRKVAVAEFEAVVSGDIYVFAPANDHLLPELLPFICMSDRFFEFAVETSAGSLSPRTNWSHLAQFEFALPPLEYQLRIVELLSTAEKSVRTTFFFANETDKTELIVLRDSFAGIHTDPAWTQCFLQDLGELKIGQQKSPKFTKGLFPRPYLKVGNIKDGQLLLNSIQEMDFDEIALAKYRLQYGDLLLTEGDLVSAANVGRSAMFMDQVKNCGYQNHLIRLRCNASVMPAFALQLLRFLFHTGVFARAAKRTTVISLGVGRVAKIPVAIPSHKMQALIVEKVQQVRDVQVTARIALDRSKVLLTEMINAIL